jgi:phosphoglucosamine mutase
MAERLFGTDGIRERAGEGALAPANVRRLGAAIARGARATGAAAEAAGVVIGRDPRPSGPEIERDLAAGLADEGARVESAGVVPTPGVSFLVRSRRRALGVVISASHNPPEYNGVKVFEADGTKASDELERAIEAAYAAPGAAPAAAPPERTPVAPELLRAYVDALGALDAKRSIAGRRVVFDCADGATGAAAPAVFRELGVEPALLHERMQGARINERCGALHPEVVAAEVRARGAFAGFSFDGDGDRVIAVDERGTVHDGDDILFALARFLRARGELPGDTVVATVLSNMGLEVALRAVGVRLERTPVGDRHVSRRLLEGSFALGGEQSGHIVLPRAIGPTGDGIACAIELLRAAAEERKPLSELLSGFRRFPQVAKNIRVKEKPPIEDVPAIVDAVRRAEQALADRGRVVVRYSGTEPLARVMVEAEDEALTHRVADEVARAIDGALNGPR